MPPKGPIAGIDGSTPPELPAYESVAAFPEGLLSGSPLESSVMLWTRVDPKLGGDGIEVRAELALDASFADVVATASATATPDTDHCVHIDMTDLAPDSWYFYRFVAGDATSAVARTRTAPAADADVSAANIAFFSCQRYTHGWYTSHRHLSAQRDLDLVISLGDYVYNDSEADGITIEGRLDPTEPATDRATFRKKYELYRSDPDLQAMHAAAPLVCIPDNHDGRVGPDDDPVFVEGAVETFFERMPVRRDPDDPARLHFETRWGRLFHLWMLDVRQYRSDRLGGQINTATDPTATNVDRTILGDAQKTWLKNGLAETDATWKLIGSSQMFAPSRIADLDDVATRASEPGRAANAGLYINGTQWDGYQAERSELLGHLHDNEIRNTIVLSGDMHWFAAGDIQVDTDDPASPYVLSEFVGSSVTSAAGSRFSSDGGPITAAILPTVRAANSQVIDYFDVDRHGYGAVKLGAAAAEVDFVSPTTIKEPNAAVEVLASFRIDKDGDGLTVTAGAQA